MKTRKVLPDVQMLKAWIPVKTFDQLEYIRDYFKLRNNIEGLIYIINAHYNLIQQWKQMIEEEQKKKEKEILEDNVVTIVPESKL